MSNYSEDKIIEMIKNFKSNKDTELRPITILNYLNKYKRLNEIEPDIINKLISAGNDKKIVNAIIKKIKSNFKNSKDYFSILSKIIKSLKNVDEDISNYIINRIFQIFKEEHKKNEEETDDKVDFEQVKLKWKDYLNFVDRIMNDNKIPNKFKILFSMYKIFPLRDDYGNVLLTDKDLDNKTNFYNVKTKIFHLNDYKTISKFGSKKYQVPDYISKLILEEYENGNKYLVGKTKDTKYALGSLSSTIKDRSKSYFGEKFTINDIRHSIIAFYDDKSVKKKKQLADTMLHSYSSQYEIYKRKE
tara:strand:+ start:53 stop:958 length:906 start_codon:yes stop_codon:yes gene_type:complete